MTTPVATAADYAVPAAPDAAEARALRSAIESVTLAARTLDVRIEAGGLTPAQLGRAQDAREAFDSAVDCAAAYERALDPDSTPPEGFPPEWNPPLHSPTLAVPTFCGARGRKVQPRRRLMAPCGEPAGIVGIRVDDATITAGYCDEHKPEPDPQMWRWFRPRDAARAQRIQSAMEEVGRACPPPDPDHPRDADVLAHVAGIDAISAMKSRLAGLSLAG